MIYLRDGGPPDPPETLREWIREKEIDLAIIINLLERARSGAEWISDKELVTLASLVEAHTLPVLREEISDLKIQLDDDEPRNLE